MFDRHGADAYEVAPTVTGDAEQAERAVVAAFVELRTDAAERYRSMPPDMRDALALATAGRCGCTEIAAIMGMDHATVRLDLLAGLRHVAAVLERWDGSPTRAEKTGDRR